ncbi:MAG: 3D domain-containing protein [Bdellovibrionota bacterium]
MFIRILLVFISLFLNQCRPTGMDANVLHASSGDKYKITYYWIVESDQLKLDADDLQNKIDVVIVDEKDKASTYQIPVKLVRRLMLEGTGFLKLQDGDDVAETLVNIACSRCDYRNAKFKVVDRDKHPYGLGARNNPLVPFRSIAVDKKEIKLGSKVYIKEFEGLQMPGGMQHDGCVVAVDTGGGSRVNT